MKGNRFRKIWEYCKKLLIARTFSWRLARLTVFLAAAILFHFLFLFTHGDESVKKQIFGGIRDIAFLIGVVQTACLLRGKGKGLRGSVKKGFCRLGHFFAGLLISGADFITGLFSSRRKKREGAGIITGYEDEQIRLKVTQAKKKRRRNHRSWSRMNPEERIRYLYGKRCIEAEKRGIEFDASETPNELQARIRSKKKEKRTDTVLFPLYNEVRYWPDFEVTEEMVDSVLGK